MMWRLVPPTPHQDPKSRGDVPADRHVQGLSDTEDRRLLLNKIEACLSTMPSAAGYYRDALHLFLESCKALDPDTIPKYEAAIAGNIQTGGKSGQSSSSTAASLSGLHATDAVQSGLCKTNTLEAGALDDSPLTPEDIQTLMEHLSDSATANPVAGAHRDHPVAESTSNASHSLNTSKQTSIEAVVSNIGTVEIEQNAQSGQGDGKRLTRSRARGLCEAP